MAFYQTRSGRRSQPALRFEDEMMDRQMAVRSQPRRDIEEEPAEEEQEVAVQPAPQNLQGSQVAGVQNAADEGTQGTQAIPATQLPDLNTLPTLEEAHSTYIPTQRGRPKKFDRVGRGGHFCTWPIEMTQMCHILTFPGPSCRPGQIFLVQNGLYMCPTYSTTCFMSNSHLWGVF